MRGNCTKQMTSQHPRLRSCIRLTFVKEIESENIFHIWGACLVTHKPITKGV
jgi:hypothetical protein